MNFKRSTKSLAIAFMALSLISMTLIQQDAFAQAPGISMTVNAEEGSDTITIAGKIVSNISDVTFTVTSPNGNRVTVGQVSPADDGSFGQIFKVGPTWTEDGLYEIKATQGNALNSLYTIKVFVLVTNGMTEGISISKSNLETGILGGDTDNVARDRGLEISANAQYGDTMIEIMGSTDRLSQDVTLTVTAPNGNKVDVAQASPTPDGDFVAMFTCGPTWSDDGFYTITASQFNTAKYTASVEVEIEDCIIVPEFGTIAAMILAVAIISIIAISARSKLSIIPRY